ncbi:MULTISPECIES: type VII secretion-associated protein [Nocardia]|uniref:type VII secretion-associated protein n=1 Tax=Nocardia TaxID=1817 RepID=UPI000D698C16|nr:MULTISPECIES: type VII secretion-associated protein [Nocardia]
MSTVELVMTDTRVWAVGPATHWEVPPSVVLGSNGNLVVGESLTPPTQVSSAVQFVPAERIALLPRVPTVVESMAALVDAVFENLGVASPAERVIVVCPTEWGGRRRSVVDAAVRRFTTDVAFEEMAIRSVTTDLSAARAARSVVLEFGAITTTASTVTPGLHGPQLESCEFEPDLAVTDLGADPRAARTLSSLLGTLLDGRPVDIVRVVGVSTPAQLETIRSSVLEVCGSDAEVRPVTGADLVRSAQPQPRYRPAPAFPANEWLQPLRERAAAQQDPKQRRTMYILGAVATVVVIAAAAVGAVVALGGSDDDAAAAPPPSSTVTAPAPSTTTRIAAPTATPAPAQEVFGRIRFQIPDDWKATPATGGSRIDLAPIDGTRLRITVIQGSVAPNAGYEQIAADLADQMKQKPTISDLRRDVVFGGRSMLAYTEKPEGGSTVRWHILVEHGTQVSIGCQYVGNGWEALATTCEEFAASVDVMP